MWIIERNRMEDEKLQEMFGDDLPPNDAPRWKEFDSWMERLELEKEEELKREDKEMDENLIRSLRKALKEEA